jgi:hypothetical protein
MYAAKNMFRHTFRHCPMLKYRLSKSRENTTAITAALTNSMKPVITSNLTLLQSSTTTHNLKARVQLFTTHNP